MVRPGAGLLAADESVATITSRFEATGIESTAESRRAYRELLLGAPGIEAHVSGVILHDETIRQCTSHRVPFPEFLADREILPGIKVDVGAKALAGAPGETVTEGLDGLRERIAEYRAMGARFAKWRAVLSIADGRPTSRAIVANAHALARYAALCQEGGLVPIVEPEVLMAGGHDISRCQDVTRDVLTELFAQLDLAEVDVAGIVLKPSMVVPGTAAPAEAVDDVAAATVRCLADTVPAAVPGVAFLSGGQRPDVATAHLDAMVRLGPYPWTLTFSYGRALQDGPLRVWAGSADNVTEARAMLLRLVRRNGAAALGRCDGTPATLE